MKPRLAGGIQAAKRVGLIRNGTTGDSIIALAVQLVRKFLVSEFTKPPAAQPAKMTGDRAWLEFISSMFNRDRTSKRLAENVVSSRHGATIQRISPRQREIFGQIHHLQGRTSAPSFATPESRSSTSHYLIP